MLIRRVNGKSMLPSLRPGQVVIARRRFFKLRQGDVIIFRHNGLEKIKRVAAIKDNKIHIVGDNNAHSTDSRHFGPIKRQDVLGKVFNTRPHAF